MKLIHGNCESWLREKGVVKTIFMDPPDNNGLAYDGFDDSKSNYIEWLAGLIWLAQCKAEIVWISFNMMHDLALTRAINIQPGWSFRRIIWYYTFGQYRKSDFANNYRPIFLLKRKDASFYPERILEESERMRINDPRSTGPRVPGDVWDFPRVVGNSIERQSWHPTQHPIALYDRVIKYSGGPFVDLFAGSGTCFRAGLLNPDVDVTGIEVSDVYVEKLRRMKNVQIEEALPS